MNTSRPLSCRILATLGALACVLAACMAAPEPDPVPRRWEFNLKVGSLRLATVDVPEVGRRAYYYLTYKVTNTTGQDLLLAPAFDLATDEGTLVRSGRDVPAEVTKQIMGQLDHPLLQDQIGILGMLLQGEENAKDGVVIWPANNLQPGEVIVFAGGFSGETKTVDIPDAKSGELTKATLRKTLMIRYDTPGEQRQRDSTPFPVVEQRWIMR